MLNKRRIFTASLVLVFLAAIVAAVPSARAAMAKPTWGVGDYWLYQTSGSGSVIPGEGTMRVEVQGTESVAVGSTSYSSYKTKLLLNITIQSPFGNLAVDVPGNAWFRVSDLAPVKMNMTVTIEILNQVITQSIVATYNPPMEMRWPLTAGASWDVSSTITYTVDSSSNSTAVTATVSVEQPESQTVPAGTFNTTPVRTTETSGDYTKAYWSSEVGNSVEEKTFDSSDVEQGSLELKSYRYTGGAGGGAGALDFLGVSFWIWLAIIAVVVVAAVALVVLRRRPPMPVQVPPTQPMPPTGPPMEPGPPTPPPPGSQP